MSALCCPHCGKALFLIQDVPGGQQVVPPGAASGGGMSGPSGSGSQGQQYPQVTFSDGKWRVNCPVDGWHAARLMAASQGRPAVVKCTAQRPDGSWCDTRVPADVARQLAGVA